MANKTAFRISGGSKMNPSKEAIDAAQDAYALKIREILTGPGLYHDPLEEVFSLSALRSAILAYISIDVDPLEKRIEELEVINEANERGILAQAKLIEELMSELDELKSQINDQKIINKLLRDLTDMPVNHTAENNLIKLYKDDCVALEARIEELEAENHGLITGLANAHKRIVELERRIEYLHYIIGLQEEINLAKDVEIVELKRKEELNGQK
jgi:hypothetical protein